MDVMEMSRIKDRFEKRQTDRQPHDIKAVTEIGQYKNRQEVPSQVAAVRA